MRRLIVPLLVIAALAGCCPPAPEDALEPNDVSTQATALTLDEPVEGQAVQGNLDLFALTTSAGQVLHFRADTLSTESQEDCPAFTVTDPAGNVLYRDTNQFCGRVGSTPEMVEGADLNILDDGYDLVVPAASAGVYLLTIDERGRADNVCDYVWGYRLRAALE